MKKLTFLTLLLLPGMALLAQGRDKEIPAFGKVEKTDLEMKECDIDKEADAMVLVDYGDITYQRGVNTTFALKKEIRQRIKLFRESAFDQANVKITYISDERYEKILDLDAYTYNLDATGKVVAIKVEKKNIFKQKEDADHSSVTFTFPEIKPGSVIEYRYVIVRETSNSIDPWIFQARIPTRVSTFRIAIPEYFQFTTSKHISLPVESKQDEYRGSISFPSGTLEYKNEEYYYKMKNIPALKYEPYMGAIGDYLQRVEFQLSQIVYPDHHVEDFRNTWPRLAASLMESEIFGAQIKKNITKGDELTRQLAKATTPTEKMLTIFRYVQKYIEWTGVEDFYCQSVKDIWSKHSGSTGDINLILLNLLKDAGIEAYPVLSSTRDHGQVVPAYPFLRQFNKLLVYAQIGEKPYILDASDKYNPAGLIPHDVMGTQAFVIIDKEKYDFITLWDGASMHKHYVIMNATVNAEDSLTGDVSLTSYDYAKNPRIKSLRQSKDKFISSYLTANQSNLQVNSLEIVNDDKDSLPLEQKFKFSQPVSSTGEYKFVNLNLFTGLEKNPFVQDVRQTNIDFGCNQYYMLVGNITIPDNYTFEEPPKNVTMIMPDTSIIFKRLLQVNGNTIGYRITLEFKRPYYIVDEYEPFKEFYKKLFTRLNEQIVFKKKA
ncbi:MAG: DUF3857 domain-containing protein [Chitinophagaceae bacterium]